MTTITLEAIEAGRDMDDEKCVFCGVVSRAWLRPIRCYVCSDCHFDWMDAGYPGIIKQAPAIGGFDPRHDA